MESNIEERFLSRGLATIELEKYRKSPRVNKKLRGCKSLRLRPLSSVENPSASLDFPNYLSTLKKLNNTKRQKAGTMVPLQQSHKSRIMTEIDLHAMGIDRIDRFDMFPELEVLDLSCNSISKMENLDNCRILQELKLYGNKISSVENIGSLKELRYLQLQYNSITTLGEGLKLKNLICLRLDHNNLTEIKCSQLCGCSNLRILNISSNRLTSLQALKVLPQLEELLAASNKLIEPPDLTPCHNLKEINLSDNQLTRINGLHFMKALEILNLSENKLNEFDFMGQQSHLTELLVSGNCLSDISYLSEQFPNLEILHLGSNRIDSWTSLTQLKDLPHLVELELKGNPFVNSNKSYHTSLIHDLPNLELLDGLKVKPSKSNGTAASDVRQKSATPGSSVTDTDSHLLKLVVDADIFGTITDRFEEVRNSFSKFLNVSLDEEKCEGNSQQKLHGSRVRIKEAQNFAATYFPSEFHENMAASPQPIMSDGDNKSDDFCF